MVKAKMIVGGKDDMLSVRDVYFSRFGVTYKK